MKLYKYMNFLVFSPPSSAMWNEFGDFPPTDNFEEVKSTLLIMMHLLQMITNVATVLFSLMKPIVNWFTLYSVP